MVLEYILLHTTPTFYLFVAMIEVLINVMCTFTYIFRFAFMFEYYCTIWPDVKIHYIFIIVIKFT